MAISSQPVREFGIEPVPQGAAAIERQMMVYWGRILDGTGSAPFDRADPGQGHSRL